MQAQPDMLSVYFQPIFITALRRSEIKPTLEVLISLFSMTGLKGCANYIWWEADHLGKGATASVYKCREKVIAVT